MKFLDESLVALDVDVNTPEEAIKAAGQLLVDADLAEDRYVEAMIQSYHENGPYFVLAPRIALPHSRPEDGVKEACVSLVRLKGDVKFGHKTNDPVRLVFGLGASSGDEHLIVLQKLMDLIGSAHNVEKLLQVECYEELKKNFGGKVK